MLRIRALENLTRDLARAVENFGFGDAAFGAPELVEKPTREAERIFQGYAKAKPSKDDAYAAARAFLRGDELDAWQRDLVAAAVAEPIRERSGAMVLGAKQRFIDLLSNYDYQLERGELWRLTWHGLLFSYFNFNVEAAKDDSSRTGWETLRRFLEKTWPAIDQQAGLTLVPDWVQVLRTERAVLSSEPVVNYAKAYLKGDTSAVDQLASDLGIPPSSWFWHALVLGAVKQATSESDTQFRERLPQLLQLIEGKPGFRDEALEFILVRYHACKGVPADERLRDFVCQPTVWKNPKLKAAGIATAWNRVPDPVWQMVLGWVNERNLKDFFDILAARNKADEGRLAFWSKYLKQITWTRLVFGADTMALQKANAEVRNLIAREEGAYAQLTGKREVDAFMMQLGRYLIIEFSKKPNACYVYEADQLPFEPYDRYYEGGTSDLAAGYRGHIECALRIVHREGWGGKAEDDLRRLGIHPDARQKSSGLSTTRSTQVTSTAEERTSKSSLPESGQGPDLPSLRTLLSRFHRAAIEDRRNVSGDGGRLWVEDPLQRTQLGAELKLMGFKWSDKRQAWYFPEN